MIGKDVSAGVHWCWQRLETFRDGAGDPAHGGNRDYPRQPGGGRKSARTEGA